MIVEIVIAEDNPGRFDHSPGCEQLKKSQQQWRRRPAPEEIEHIEVPDGSRRASRNDMQRAELVISAPFDGEQDRRDRRQLQEWCVSAVGAHQDGQRQPAEGREHHRAICQRIELAGVIRAAAVKSRNGAIGRVGQREARLQQQRDAGDGATQVSRAARPTPNDRTISTRRRCGGNSAGEWDESGNELTSLIFDQVLTGFDDLAQGLHRSASTPRRWCRAPSARGGSRSGRGSRARCRGRLSVREMREAAGCSTATWPPRALRTRASRWHSRSRGAVRPLPR